MLMETASQTGVQVETTISKGLLRVLTTALGGAIAVGVMASPKVATNPYALSVIVLAFDFGIALFMRTQFQYAGTYVHKRCE